MGDDSKTNTAESESSNQIVDPSVAMNSNTNINNTSENINNNTNNVIVNIESSAIPSQEELRQSDFKVQTLEVDLPSKKIEKENKWKKYGSIGLNIFLLILLLYLFICGLTLLSDSFRVVAGKAASQLFGFCDNPIAGLVVGIISTVCFQSSSTTTSIVVSLVGVSAISVGHAVPIIMGANIGTSVTNTLVAIGQIKSGNEFRRAFSGATIHDFFNLLSVLVLLPIEWIVMSFNNECGFLCWLTGLITDAMAGTSGATFESPLDAIVKPFAKLFIQVNKKAYNAFSMGCGPDAKAHCPSPDASLWDYGCFADDGVTCISPDEWHETYDGMSIIKSCFMKDSWGWSDMVCGIILLVFSLVLLCGSLVFMVKVLHKLIFGKAEKYLKKAFNMNGVVALIVGCGITILVQSSSVVTSTLTPLVGVGVLKLEKMLPLTLGANIGTTTTSLIAALAAASTDSIQIAFCHLFFNIIGILIWYPLPFMRKVPINCALWLGETVQVYRWFGFVYIFGVFLIIPFSLLGISILFSSGTITAIIGGVLVGILLILLISFIIYYKYFNGKEKIKFILSKTAHPVTPDADDDEEENEKKKSPVNETKKIEDKENKIEIKIRA